MSTALELVRAGAGAGKTTDLCDIVSEAVRNGLDPARILATTFTRKAAVQLKGRVQAKLLIGDDVGSEEAHARADRLELAAIGTVHSVAHQLVSKHALALGLSPRLLVLDTEGTTRTLDNLLAEASDSWDDLHEVAGRLGISELPELVLNVLSLQRGNGVSDEGLQAQLADSADRLSELLSPQVETDGVSHEQLYTLIAAALTQIESLNDTTKVTQGAIEKLRGLAGRRSDAWGTHVQASKISAGKRSGADGMLSTLHTEAGRIRGNPGLHRDIRQFVQLISSKAVALGGEYLRFKQERGLVDFTDLEVLFLRLLEDERLWESLRSDFELVLVDEFQDTNPLQLAIFQRLRALAKRSRWVGDPNQAIYGFRDADPNLVNSVWNGATDASRTKLPKNFRAQRGIVQFVNAVVAPILGDDAGQEPHRSSTPRGLERWMLEARNQEDESSALACGVSQLHSEGLSLRSIAVLGRTNAEVARAAKALDVLGVPYLLESPGLFSTREGAILLAALRLVADRRDALAAATLLHLIDESDGETPGWFGERLHAVSRGEEERQSDTPWAGDERLRPLESIDARTLSPQAVVHRVIEAIRAGELVAGWGDPSRRSGHLDAVVAHAAEYEQSSIEEGRSATLTGLVLHLENLADEDKDFRSAPLGHDAVTLLTYHAAKGLEWPVVVLTGLDYERSPELWSPTVVAGDLQASSPLDDRAIRYWCWPFGYTEGQFAQRVSGSGLEDDALASSEGTESSRREADESLRLLYVGMTRAREKLVFAHRPGRARWLSKYPEVDRLLPPDAPAGEHSVPGVETTLVLRKLSADLTDSCRLTRPESEVWFSPIEAWSADAPPRRFHQPSDQVEQPTRARIEVIGVSEESVFPSGAKEADFAFIGEAVHAFFAALPSLAMASREATADVAKRCLETFGVSGLLSAEALVAQAEAFARWVGERYPDAVWRTETPITAPRASGGQWVGAVDLVLELESGVVVVDHKSAPLRRQQCASKAIEYTGQLEAYVEALSSAGENVVARYVHFPLAGVVCQLN